MVSSLQALADPPGAPNNGSLNGGSKTGNAGKSTNGGTSGGGSTGYGGGASSGSTSGGSTGQGGKTSGGSTSGGSTGYGGSTSVGSTNSGNKGGGSTGKTTSTGGGSNLSFGSNYGSAPTGMIGGGKGGLGYSSSVTGGKTAPSKSTSGQGLSMGSVVSETNKDPSKPGGGFDKSGNYYSAGKSIPGSNSATKAISGLLAGALSGTTVVGTIGKAVAGSLGFTYEVSKKTIDKIGKIVEPHARTLVEATQAAVTAGKVTAAELSKPALRDALGGALGTKGRVGKVEARAFYTAVANAYVTRAIPPEKQWVASGPMNYAQRFNSSYQHPADLAAGALLDSRYRAGVIDVVVPDDSALWTPNRVGIAEKALYSHLNGVQRVGANNTMTVTGPAAELNAIAEAFGFTGALGCNCGAHFGTAGFQIDVGPLAGGMVMVNDEIAGFNDTLSHEFTHAGDAAIQSDLAGLYATRDTLSLAERAVVESRMMAANMVANQRNIAELSGALAGLVNDEYVGSFNEQRAYEQQLDPNGYANAIEASENISREEAREIADTIKNDPVLNEISQRLEDHANDMLGREENL